VRCLLHLLDEIRTKTQDMRKPKSIMLAIRGARPGLVRTPLRSTPAPGGLLVRNRDAALHVGMKSAIVIDLARLVCTENLNPDVVMVKSAKYRV
jgi:hypothetical protein